MNADGIARQVEREAIGAALVSRATSRARPAPSTSDTAPAASSRSGRPATSATPRSPSGAAERAQQPRREIEPGQDQRALEDNPLPDVAVHVMRELVRQDDLDLLVGVFGEHRVRHEDPPRRAEAGQRRIGFLGLVGEAPLVRAEHARTRAFGERQQPRAQRVAIERLHRVEQRQQQHRRQIGQADDQQREHQAGRQPPALGRERGCSQ